MERSLNAKKLDGSQQMKLLLGELWSNRESLNACRGLLGLPQVEIFKKWIADEPSVSKVAEKWKSMTTHYRVMLYYLAKLKRDGDDKAFQQLEKALESPQYIMDMEEFPIEETRPVTVLMLQPEATWTMIWMMTSDYHCRWQWKHIRRHFPEFPKLRSKFNRSTTRNNRRGQEYVLAYREAITDQVDPIALEGAEDLFLESNQIQKEVPSKIPLAYLFDGLDASRVMARFNLEKGWGVAMWEFQIPKFLQAFKVGLHPENCHAQWRVAHPSLVSIRTESDFGGLILPVEVNFNRIHYKARHARDHWNGQRPYRGDIDAGYVFVSTAEKRQPSEVQEGDFEGYGPDDLPGD